MFQGLLDMAVFLERFRNIDLYQQGLYQLRVAITQGQNAARPYDCVKTAKPESLYNLVPPYCDGEGGYYHSSTFLIRYSEEEAQLRELCMFRLEGDPQEMDLLEMSIDLLYSEIDRDFTAETLQARLNSMESISFRPVSTLRLQLRKPCASILEPLVLDFDDSHKCLLLGCFTCVMFNYQFRTAESEKKQKEMLYQAIAKVLVVDRLGQPKRLAGADETDRLYEDFVRPQALSHELLRSYLCDLINRYLPPTVKAQYTDLPPPLSLPHSVRPGGVKGSRFSQAVVSHEAVDICQALMAEIAFIAEQIYRLVGKLRELLATYPLHCMSPLFDKRLERMRNWSAGSVKRNSARVTKIPSFQEVDCEEYRKRIAREQRQLNATMNAIHESPIESAPGDPRTGPILFEDSYFQPDAAPPPRQPEVRQPRHGKKHLFVLVHGFRGKPLDLRLVKHTISCYSTGITVLCAASNEGDTDRDLFDMGEKLAREVKEYIAEWLPGQTLMRLSFVGYSLGGLIVRAALPHLAEFEGLMHSFISFSAPHLGHMSDASLVGAGLWVLERFRKTQLLQQLLLNDHADSSRTALYRLSQTTGLEWFQHVMVCSSFQDKYVPRDSARIELSSAMGSQGKGQSYADMARNVLARIAPDRFVRVDVDFCENGVSFDTVTGRSAHLMFVTNEHFLKLLVYQYPELFS